MATPPNVTITFLNSTFNIFSSQAIKMSNSDEFWNRWMIQVTLIAFLINNIAYALAGTVVLFANWESVRVMSARYRVRSCCCPKCGSNHSNNNPNVCSCCCGLIGCVSSKGVYQRRHYFNTDTDTDANANANANSTNGNAYYNSPSKTLNPNSNPDHHRNQYQNENKNENDNENEIVTPTRRRFSFTTMATILQDSTTTAVAPARCCCWVLEDIINIFVPRLLFSIFIPAFIVLFGIIRWLPVIFGITFLSGSAFFVPLDVLVTSAQATGFGFSQGLLIIYYAFGRGWNRSLFLFPQHSYAKIVYKISKAIYPVDAKRKMDLRSLHAGEKFARNVDMCMKSEFADDWMMVNKKETSNLRRRTGTKGKRRQNYEENDVNDKKKNRKPETGKSDVKSYTANTRNKAKFRKSRTSVFG